MKNKIEKLISLVDPSKYGDLTMGIEQALKLINFNFNKKIKKIAIKPNLCYYWDSYTGETTDPKVVEAIIDIFRAHTNINMIYLVESDATAMKTKYAFKMLGYEKLTEKKDVKLINLSEDNFISVKTNDNPIFSQIKIPEILTKVDLFISVPKLKLHPLPGLTCALKNQFGCIPIERKIMFHKNLHEIIAFINKHITPDLVLVDGIICKGKTPKRLNLIMAGSDPVAVDSTAAKIAGLNPRRIRYIVKSENFGVGSTNVRCVGEEWQTFADDFPQKGFINDLSLKLSMQLYDMYLRLFTFEGKIFKMGVCNE